jgi:protoporphyrinogen oxidase
MKKKIIIIGAGPCGLGALWALHERGYDNVELYERSDHAGGMSSTCIDAHGFVWDIGGHVIGSKHEAFIKQMYSLYAGSFEHHERNAWVMIGTSLVPYPVQYHHAHIQSENDARVSSASSFYDWLYMSFGKELTRNFFFPFNRKLWKYSLQKMSTTWIRDKIPQQKDAHVRNKWGTNASFYYPSHGGIGSVWSGIAEKVNQHIVYNTQVVAIDAIRHELTCADHSTVSYDGLISTIPLPTLANIVTGVDMREARALPYVGVAVAGFGIAGKPPTSLEKCHWIYVSDANIPYFRVSVYSNYGTGNAPKGTWSLLFETSISPDEHPNAKQHIKMVQKYATAQGLIPTGSEIMSTFFRHEPFGYPTPIMGRDQTLSRIQSALAERNIVSCGRFGSWKYEESNMDQVWRMGGEVATSTINIL